MAQFSRALFTCKVISISNLSFLAKGNNGLTVDNLLIIGEQKPPFSCVTQVTLALTHFRTKRVLPTRELKREFSHFVVHTMPSSLATVVCALLMCATLVFCETPGAPPALVLSSKNATNDQLVRAVCENRWTLLDTYVSLGQGANSDSLVKASLSPVLASFAPLNGTLQVCAQVSHCLASP